MPEPDDTPIEPTNDGESVTDFVPEDVPTVEPEGVMPTDVGTHVHEVANVIETTRIADAGHELGLDMAPPE